MKVGNPFATPAAILGVTPLAYAAARTAVQTNLQGRPGDAIIETDELVPLHPALVNPRVLLAILGELGVT